jgi:hypothetical protein
MEGLDAVDGGEDVGGFVGAALGVKDAAMVGQHMYTSAFGMKGLHFAA